MKPRCLPINKMLSVCNWEVIAPMQQRVADVESAILRVCAGSTEPSNPIILAVRYHLSRPGHLLRARLCLDACARLEVPTENAVIAASVCELLHNASLVQDDLMDRSPLRRGQPSTWSRFGDGVAVCAGDLMLASAYASLQKLTPGASVAEVVPLVHARTQDLICGQAEDLQMSVSTSSIAQYRRVAVAKSLPLISLAMELPLTLAGLGPACKLAQQVAAAFAESYQIADDLDDTAEDERAGCMNLVHLLIAAGNLSFEEAKRTAKERAGEQLDAVFTLAKSLPGDCGAVLTEHAMQLRAALGISAAVTP